MMSLQDDDGAVISVSRMKSALRLKRHHIKWNSPSCTVLIVIFAQREGPSLTVERGSNSEAELTRRFALLASRAK